MTKILVILVGLFLVKSDIVKTDTCDSSITVASGLAVPKHFCSGELIFVDYFNEFNKNIWQHEQTLGGYGNNEFEWYTDDRNNSYADNGILNLVPTFVADEFGEDFLYSGTIDLGSQCTSDANNGCRRTGTPTSILNPIKSARIRTLNSFSFKYGKVEVRARAPSGDWLWPAIWMLPSKSVYGEWPTSGEIDIMETRGNEKLFIGSVNIGSSQVSSTLNWGPNRQYNEFMLTHFEKNSDVSYSQDFHKYRVEWTPDYIQFFVDNQFIGIIAPPSGGFWELGNLNQTGLPNPWINGDKMAPFDQEFHIIINLAIGGNFFPDNAENGNGKKPWTYGSDSAMTDFWEGKEQWEPTWNRSREDFHFQIDYVKVWAL